MDTAVSFTANILILIAIIILAITKQSKNSAVCRVLK